MHIAVNGYGKYFGVVSAENNEAGPGEEQASSQPPSSEPQAPVADADRVPEPAPPEPSQAATEEPPSGPGDADGASLPGRPRRPIWRSVAAGGAVIVVAGGAYAMGRTGTDGGTTATPTTTTSTGPRVTVPADFVTYTDSETGFTLRHPKSWTPAREPEGDVRLVLAAGGLDSVLVRVIRIEQPVTKDNLADVKAFTDAIVSGSDVQMIQERQVTINGMPGWYYLYTFSDTQSGEKGVHAHYFLFQGRKMNTLVFQALPADGFSRLAPTFDQIAESFKSTPDSSAPAGSTTSTTG